MQTDIHSEFSSDMRESGVDEADIPKETTFRNAFHLAPELSHISVSSLKRNFGRCQTCTEIESLVQVHSFKLHSFEPHHTSPHHTTPHHTTPHLTSLRVAPLSNCACASVACSKVARLRCAAHRQGNAPQPCHRGKVGQTTLLHPTVWYHCLLPAA